MQRKGEQRWGGDGASAEEGVTSLVRKSSGATLRCGFPGLLSQMTTPGWLKTAEWILSQNLILEAGTLK